MDNDNQNPLENPIFRHGIGLGGAAMIFFVAFFFLEGTLRYIAVAIGTLDAFVTPAILKKIAENNRSDAESSI